MRPAVFPINLVGPWCMGTYIVPNILFSCGLAAGACLAMCWRISLIRHLLWLCSLCGFSRLLRLQIYFSILLTLVGSQTHVSTVLGNYFHWNSFSDGAGWRPLAWLVSAHKVTMETSLRCLILAQGTHHQFPSSSFGDEFNQVIFKGNFSFRVFEFDSVIFYLFLYQIFDVILFFAGLVWQRETSCFLDFGLLLHTGIVGFFLVSVINKFR